MGISCASEMLEDIPGQLNMTDDILVFGKNKEDHHENLMRVMKRLEENGITLNSKKCQFYKSELTFYGLRLTSRGISPTEDRFEALREAPAPTNAKDLKSFFAVLNSVPDS